ncbi:hypothetical protein BDA99DRAFT_559996 [Phascolomyces articulosus]|uniref:CCHC-type domain-containing protein n=1 Tax=Phascolomyces articulosus TaxID=60185 RepID=A0AAD5PFU2_9FUNG|nr:hypothetical protein BDA99DRAFT_559996 [Phascolomyces articulosus]
MSTPICNTCGLPSHQRTNHRDCLANPNRIAMRENEERDYDESRVVPVPVCASCGQEGHSHSTHSSCPNNPSNINNDDINNEEPNLEPTLPVRVCASCGQEGHLRNTHRSCPNYRPRRNNTQQQNLHNIARVSSSNTPTRHSLGSIDNECNSCHAQLFIQERTSGSSIRNPFFNLCCQEGAVELPPLNPTPPAISRLLHGSDIVSNHFRQYIYAYNSALSFTSLGVNIDQTVANMHGGAPAFAQIYIHDPATETAEQQATETANRQAVSNV